jgi:hypothetical protein
MRFDGSEIGSQRPPCRGPPRRAMPFAKSKRESGQNKTFIRLLSGYCGYAVYLRTKRGINRVRRIKSSDLS